MVDFAFKLCCFNLCVPVRPYPPVIPGVITVHNASVEIVGYRTYVTGKVLIKSGLDQPLQVNGFVDFSTANGVVRCMLTPPDPWFGCTLDPALGFSA
jgi:hypothetical protein